MNFSEYNSSGVYIVTPEPLSGDGGQKLNANFKRLVDLVQGIQSGLGSAAGHADSYFALASHSHTISNVTGLQTALDDLNASIGAIYTEGGTYGGDTSYNGTTVFNGNVYSNNTLYAAVISSNSDPIVFGSNIDANGKTIEASSISSSGELMLTSVDGIFVAGNFSINGYSPLSTEYDLSDLNNVAQARINLGLGSASIRADTYFALASNAIRVLSYITGSGSSINNTTSETAFSDTYTFPANSLAVNDLIRVRIKGYYGTTISGPTLTLKLKLGSTVITTTGAVTLGPSASNRSWTAELDILVKTTGSSGTINAQGIVIASPPGMTQAILNWSNTADVTINTTTSQALSVTAQFGTANAANTITMKQMIIEKAGS